MNLDERAALVLMDPLAEMAQLESRVIVVRPAPWELLELLGPLVLLALLAQLANKGTEESLAHKGLWAPQDLLEPVESQDHKDPEVTKEKLERLERGD